MRRWLRVLICLLLVCCILVNLSPLRAEAVSATAIACSVAIPVAVAVGLNALGVRQGSDSTAFNNVVSSAVDALSPEWAVNGLTTMLALTTDGVTKTFVNRNFLQELLDTLFSKEILVSGVCLQDGATSAVEDIIATAATHKYAFYWYSSGNHLVGWNDSSPFYHGYSSSMGYYVTTSSGVSFSLYSNGSYQGSGSIFYRAGTNIQFFGTGVDAEITASEDLTLESVGHDIDTDYATYAATGIIDDDGIPWVPTTIPSLSTDTFVDQTQAQAQAGTTSEAIVEELLGTQTDTDVGAGTITGTGTIADVITAIKAIPTTFAASFADVIAAVQAIPIAISEFFTPKAPDNHDKFALADLSRFFPFCIPFDLYDFFQLLNAEPVAPVLSWEIKDLAGQTYSLEVDLSQWDSVALLFRRLQLFLFITGLAAASRKFIKW